MRRFILSSRGRTRRTRRVVKSAIRDELKTKKSVSDVPRAAPRVARDRARPSFSEVLAPREQQVPENGGEHEEQQRGFEGQKDLYQLYSSRPQNASTKSSRADLDAKRAARSKA